MALSTLMWPSAILCRSARDGMPRTLAHKPERSEAALIASFARRLARNADRPIYAAGDRDRWPQGFDWSGRNIPRRAWAFAGLVGGNPAGKTRWCVPDPRRWTFFGGSNAGNADVEVWCAVLIRVEKCQIAVRFRSAQEDPLEKTRGWRLLVSDPSKARLLH